MRFAVGLLQPNDWRYLCCASQNRPNLSGVMHLASRFVLVVANDDVAPKSDTITGMSTAMILRDRVIFDQLEGVFAHTRIVKMLAPADIEWKLS